MYRPKPKRLFPGLAGSPLSHSLNDSIAQKSDFALRRPKTPDRCDPVVLDPLTEWIDKYGQKHGAIDQDCAFQTCQFDPALGGGSRPDETGDVPSHAGAAGHEASFLAQGFRSDPPTMPKSKRRIGYSTGLLEGDRQIKMRRITPETEWIFDRQTFISYLKYVQEQFDTDSAVKIANVFYDFYYCGREDLDIWYKYHRQYWDTANEPTAMEMVNQDAPRPLEIKGREEVRNFRQYQLKLGQKFAGYVKAKSPACRIFIVHYTYEGHGIRGEFTEGTTARPDELINVYIGELSELRREQGFEIKILLKHTIDRLFPNFEKAMAFATKEIGLQPVAEDQLIKRIPKAPDAKPA